MNTTTTQTNILRAFLATTLICMLFVLFSTNWVSEDNQSKVADAQSVALLEKINYLERQNLFLMKEQNRLNDARSLSRERTADNSRTWAGAFASPRRGYALRAHGHVVTSSDTSATARNLDGGWASSTREPNSNSSYSDR